MVTDTPTGPVRTDCWVCSTVVEADDVPGVGEAFLTHVRGPEACRGFRDMYEERGFELVEERERDRVVRIRA